MVYTRVGPFTDGSAAPPINAGFLNGVETFLATIGGLTNTYNTVTGWFHIDQYGAVPGVTTLAAANLNLQAMKACMTAANARYVATGQVQSVYVPPGVFSLDVENFANDDGSIFGIVCLYLFDGIDMFGPGTLKVFNGAYAAGGFFGMIRSKSSGVSNSSIRGITFDGNKPNLPASVQCSNILLTAKDNVVVANTSHKNVNGQAIMVGGTPAYSCRNVRIVDNFVADSAAIGIQASRFLGVTISRNTVLNTVDNGIDIYGENGPGNPSIGDGFIISDNRIDSCGTGIFPETVVNGVVTNNLISNCGVGIHVNRINAEPHNIYVGGNMMEANPTGVLVSGDTGGVDISHNQIGDSSVACIQLGGGSGNVSGVTVESNQLNCSDMTHPLVGIGGNQAAFINIRQTRTRSTNRFWDVVNLATTSFQVNVATYPN